MRTGIPVYMVALALLAMNCEMEPTEQALEGPPEQLINGDETADDEYLAIGKVNSYFCSGIACWFNIYSRGLCTGTLIAPDVVLAAGHCVHELPDHDGYYVQFKPKNSGAVDAAFWTDYWTENGAGDDLVLIVLESPITDIDPMMIMESDDSVAAGDQVTHVGYGCNTTEKKGSGTQRDGVADVVSASTSNDTVVTTRDNDADNDVSVCEGDSGGPVIESIDDGKIPRNRVIGVHHARDEYFTNSHSAYLKDHRNGTINPFMRYHCDQGNRDADTCQDWRSLPTPVQAPYCGDGTCNGSETCYTCSEDCESCCDPDYANCLKNSDCCSGRCVCVGEMGNVWGYCCPKGKPCKFC